jgi:hypothetical protein
MKIYYRTCKEPLIIEDNCHQKFELVKGKEYLTSGG